MQIAKNTVVAIDYVLKDDNGQVLDSSADRTPLSYLHGASAIIPGLERALDGKQAGDQDDTKVAGGRSTLDPSCGKAPDRQHQPERYTQQDACRLNIASPHEHERNHVHAQDRCCDRQSGQP